MTVESILAIMIVVLLLVFIVKITSAIWRIIGIIVLGALIWLFRSEIIAQFNQWFTVLETGNLWDNIKEWVISGWQALVDWFGRLAS